MPTWFGVAVMLLWNALLPSIFALPQIGYLQAVGLLVLVRLLFGGIGGNGWHHYHHGRRHKWGEKWRKFDEFQSEK